MLSTILLPVTTLILGWFLHDVITKRFEILRERKAHIGRALSNLLELHHRIRAIENTIQQLTRQFSLPEDAEQVLRPFFEQLLPQEGDFVAKYEEAIEQLSESDPLTAFEFRTKSQLPHFLKSIREVASLQGASIQEMTFMEKQLKELLIPSLEEAIRELACLYGGSTKRRVHAMLAAPFQLPDNAKNFLLRLQAEYQKQPLATENTEITEEKQMVVTK